MNETDFLQKAYNLAQDIADVYEEMKIWEIDSNIDSTCIKLGFYHDQAYMFSALVYDELDRIWYEKDYQMEGINHVI